MDNYTWVQWMIMVWGSSIFLTTLMVVFGDREFKNGVLGFLLAFVLGPIATFLLIVDFMQGEE